MKLMNRARAKVKPPPGGHLGDYSVGYSVIVEGEATQDDREHIVHCLTSALTHLQAEHCEVAVRVVDEEESTQFNCRYRGIEAPTNVLSFPCELTDESGLRLMGDILICHPLMKSEAVAQNKTIKAHYAHLCIHGLLHLMGYDHAKTPQAEEMEKLEAELLQALGIENPYELDE